jgi:hypothetical protein
MTVPRSCTAPAADDVVLIAGARPNFMKLAPLLRELASISRGDVANESSIADISPFIIAPINTQWRTTHSFSENT